MELHEEILSKILIESVSKALSANCVNFEEAIRNKSYKALIEIKNIIEDDSLEDDECFMKIEEIVRVFESIGSDGGNRHDFG